MSASSEEPVGVDLTVGMAVSSVPLEGFLAGHVGDDAVLVARVDGELHAVSAVCTHWNGPLQDGLRTGGRIHCPWHHACFDLRTGAALKAPALSPLDRWRVEEHDGTLWVREKLPHASGAEPTRNADERIVIVGGGGAGFAAAQRLRDLGFAGSLVMISQDADAPYDRPNLSKDYLAGKAEEAWIPLRGDAFYRDHRIDLRVDTTVTAIDAGARRLTLEGGEVLAYDRLLLATGSEPSRPPTPGFDRETVHVLRSLADANRLIAAADKAKTAVVVGASFIGMEVAAGLRQRGLAVHVVGQESLPFESKLGPQIGGFFKSVHETEQVRFHLQRKVASYVERTVTLDDGSTIETDFLVLGMGVKPRLALAEAAGLTVDGGVMVDAAMRTSDAAIFAAGDIARYPEPATGEPIRVEHWVVAQRQGQTAAASMLGLDQPLTDPPFFWTYQYEASVQYVGHAESWDRIEEDGSTADGDAVLRFVKDGRVAAVAALDRDLALLRVAAELGDR